MRPVGGWTVRKSSAFATAPRAMISYLDNSSDEYMAAGTYDKLYYVNPSLTVTDITPSSGFTSGALNGALNQGYGGGFLVQQILVHHLKIQEFMQKLLLGH